MNELGKREERAIQKPQTIRYGFVRKLAWLIPVTLGMLCTVCETVVAQHGTCSFDLSFYAKCAMSAALFATTFWVVTLALKHLKGHFIPSFEGGVPLKTA